MALFIVVGLLQEWYLLDYNELGKYEPVHRQKKSKKENDKNIPLFDLLKSYDGPQLKPKLNWLNYMEIDGA